MKQTSDGSFLVSVDSAGSGLFANDGSTRVSTNPTGRGIYDKTGAFRVSFEQGLGIYTKDGRLRVSTEAGNGVYDSTGAWRVSGTGADVAAILGQPDVVSEWSSAINLDPKNVASSNWSTQGSTSPVFTNIPGVGAFQTPTRIASDGQTFARRNSSQLSLTTGVPVQIKVLYRAGTSPNFGVYVHYAAGATTSQIMGPVGALASTATAAGTWSSIVNTNLGEGFYMVEATFTPSATRTDFQLGVSPRSSVVGQYVDVYAAAILP